jgi:hypothetical protein
MVIYAGGGSAIKMGGKQLKIWACEMELYSFILHYKCRRGDSDRC